MRLHPNAKLTPSNRRLLIRRIRELNWSVTEAAEATGVSRQPAYKWLRGISTPDAGNAHLPEFRADYNERFAREPTHGTAQSSRRPDRAEATPGAGAALDIGCKLRSNDWFGPGP